MFDTGLPPHEDKTRNVKGRECKSDSFDLFYEYCHDLGDKFSPNDSSLYSTDEAGSCKNESYTAPSSRGKDHKSKKSKHKEVRKHC